MSDEPTSRPFWELEVRFLAGVRGRASAFAQTIGSFIVKRGLILTALGWLAVMWLTFNLLEFDPNLSPFRPADWTSRNDATGLRDYFWAWSLPLGALLVSLTLVNALRRTRVMELQTEIEKVRADTAERELIANISDRRDELNASTFAQATAMLSSAEEITRMGAVQSLGELMRVAFDDPNDRRRVRFGWSIGVVLVAFARTNVSKEDTSTSWHSFDMEADKYAALNTAVRDWPSKLRPGALGLGYLNLTKADLRGWVAPPNADLSYFMFDDADLSHARIFESEISSATFLGTKMDNIQIHASHILACDFSKSKISGYFSRNLSQNNQFRQTDFSNCHIIGTKFSSCHFYLSKFKGAVLNGVEFEFSFSGSDSSEQNWLELFRSARWAANDPPTLPIPLPHDGQGNPIEDT